MAKGYTSTSQVRCWKEHACVSCGSMYAYILSRKAVGTGPSPEKASAKMQARIATIVRDDTDMQPCPTCGLYQPDMIGQRRAKRRMQILVISLILFIVALIIRAADGLQSNILTWAAAGICGLTVLAHLLVEMQNPNRDLMGNQQLAQDRVTKGELRHSPGQKNVRADDMALPSRSMAHMLALVMLLASVALVISPEGLRSSRKWPLNEACYPPVVGPGDHTRIYLPQKIQSIKDYWRAWPTVVIRHDDVEMPIEATTNQNDWGSTIYAKSEEKSTSSHPWVNINVPDKPELAGKRITCDILLKLEYPQINPGGSNFTVIHTSMKHSLSVDLAPRGAGAQYNSLWWGATAGTAGLVFLAGLMLYGQAKALQRQAKPTKAFQA